MIFTARICSISCSEAAKARRVHLLLKQVAWVRIMYITRLLQPLDQALWVVVHVEGAASARLRGAWCR